MRKHLITVAALVVAVIAVAAGSATAASQITAHQMGTGSVNSRVVKDFGVHQNDLSSRLQGRINEGVLGLHAAFSNPQNTTQSADLTAGSVPTGGSFNANAVEVGTLALTPGTYLVNLGAKATPNVANTVGVFPQFFVYNQEKNASFEGNLFNVGSGSLAEDNTNIDSYYSGSEVVTISENTTLHVYAFGYDSDRGASTYALDSGTITATRLTN